MMQLGLTGSIKTDDGVVAYKKSNGDTTTSKNQNKANDFAKALDGGQSNRSAGSSEEVGANDRQAKLTDAEKHSDVTQRATQQNAEQFDLLSGKDESIISGLVDVNGSKSTNNTNSKQIAFVTIDNLLAEKLAPVNVVNANNTDGVAVDINGARKTINMTAEKLANSSALSENDKNKNQVVLKNSNEAKNSTTAPETMTNKVAFKTLSQAEIKNQKETQNAISKSKSAMADEAGVDADKIANKNAIKNSVETNVKTVSKFEIAANENAKEANLSKMTNESDKTGSAKSGAEVLAEKSANKNDKAVSAKTQINTAQIKGKSSTNTVNLITETKIENLGNALQQVVVTTQGKSGAQVETVSAPRFVLPESQSVVPQKTIEIQLLPKTLGLIQVKIEILDGKMTLMIEAQTAKAEAAIKQEIVQIIDTIKAAGLSVEEISVRRNAELSQQEEAINDFSSEDKAQGNLENGTFDDHFDGQKDQDNSNDLARQGAENGASSIQDNTRTGIYL